MFDLFVLSMEWIKHHIMAKAVTYLYFSRNTEEAFRFYRSVFVDKYGVQWMFNFNAK